MAKVIKEEAKQIKCPHCQCLVEYTEEDVENCFGNIGLVCPGCNEYITIKKLDSFDFPNAFNFCSAKNKNTVHILEEEVQKYVKRVEKMLETDDFCYTGTGDTIVIGFKMTEDNETHIIVAQDYYEGIRFDEE